MINTRVEPIPSDKHVTCWVKVPQQCQTPATWFVRFDSPPRDTLIPPLMAVCDVHLYDFEVDTSGSPPER